MYHLRTINRVALLSLLLSSSHVRPFAVNNLPQIKSHESGLYIDGVTLMPNFIKSQSNAPRGNRNTRTYLRSLRRESSLIEEEGRKKDDRMKNGREET